MDSPRIVQMTTRMRNCPVCPIEVHRSSPFTTSKSISTALLANLRCHVMAGQVVNVGIVPIESKVIHHLITLYVQYMYVFQQSGADLQDQAFQVVRLRNRQQDGMILRLRPPLEDAQ